MALLRFLFRLFRYTLVANLHGDYFRLLYRSLREIAVISHFKLTQFLLVNRLIDRI